MILGACKYRFHYDGIQLCLLGVEKVGDFVLQRVVNKNTSRVKRKLELVLSEKIIWPGNGAVPRDSPKCGFEGEYCMPESKQKEDKGMV